MINKNIYQEVLCLINKRLPFGKLPDFLIIGVQKGGTSSLWYHLQQHPQIEMSPKYTGRITGGQKGSKKEVHFFDDEEVWNKGIYWYKSLFNNNGKLQGEATPAYISKKVYCQRMFEVIPKAKLILILRDPVSRALSAYNHARQEEAVWGNLDYRLTFEENLTTEIRDYFEKDGMIKRGFYIDQIKELLSLYPKEQLLILISEQMKKKLQQTYNKIFDFLDVKRIEINYDPDIHKRKYDVSISKQTEKMMYKIYDKYNELLFQFLGYRIPEWEKH